MENTTWKRELAIGSGLLAAGLLILPPAIYLVGRRVVGEYAPDAGVLTLAEDIWSDFFSLRPAAWLLVLSPYLTVLLARLLRRVWQLKNV